MQLQNTIGQGKDTYIETTAQAGTEGAIIIKDLFTSRDEMNAMGVSKMAMNRERALGKVINPPGPLRLSVL